MFQSTFFNPSSLTGIKLTHLCRNLAQNIVRDFLALRMSGLHNWEIYKQGYTVKNQQSVTGLQKPEMSVSVGKFCY